jgi:solute carrier family 35 protein E3
MRQVFNGGFHFPMSLSFFHFVFTWLWYQMLYAAGVYSNPEPGMSQVEKFKVALFGFASIGFMNLSLNYNSVGFYQVTKLTIVPVTLVIQSVAYAVYSTTKVKLSLAILLAGVAIATVTDVELRPTGLIFGVLAVLSTAVFQIWQGTKQKEFGISATQLQAGIAPWQSIQAAAVSIATECYCYEPSPSGAPCDTAVRFFELAFAGDHVKQHTLWIVLGTCILALAVNLCSFGLIGRTSPITFQVVGHAKTCLVLTGGYVFFSSGAGDTQQIINNIAGVSVAMIGVLLYGHIQQASSGGYSDCLDAVCPGCILYVIEPKYASEESAEELKGLKGPA